MSRVVTATVPTEYQPLDTRVTDADSIMNVRDLQVARQNHNILYAKRVKRTICVLPRDSVNSYGPIGVDPDTGNPTLAWRQRILLNQGTRRVRLYIRAQMGFLDVASTLPLEDSTIYPVISDVFGDRKYDPNVSMNITDPWTGAETDAATYTADLAVPVRHGAPAFAGRLLYNLLLFVVGKIDTTYALASGMAITDAGDDWVLLATPVTNPGVAITIGTDTRIAIGALTGRTLVDKPWSSVPDPGTDTATLRQTTLPVIYSMSAYEMVETTLSGTDGAI